MVPHIAYKWCLPCLSMYAKGNWMKKEYLQQQIKWLINTWIMKNGLKRGHFFILWTHNLCRLCRNNHLDSYQGIAGDILLQKNTGYWWIFFDIILYSYIYSILRFQRMRIYTYFDSLWNVLGWNFSLTYKAKWLSRFYFVVTIKFPFCTAKSMVAQNMLCAHEGK